MPQGLPPGAAEQLDIFEGTIAVVHVLPSPLGPPPEERMTLIADESPLRTQMRIDLDENLWPKIVSTKEAEHFRKLLQPGAWIAVRGDGIETPHGRVIESKEIGPDLAHLKPAKRPNHRNGHN